MTIDLQRKQLFFLYGNTLTCSWVFVCCMISVIFIYWRSWIALRSNTNHFSCGSLLYGLLYEMQLYFDHCLDHCLPLWNVTGVMILHGSVQLLPISMGNIIILAAYFSIKSFLNLLNFSYCSCFDYTNALAVRFFFFIWRDSFLSYVF